MKRVIFSVKGSDGQNYNYDLINGDCIEAYERLKANSLYRGKVRLVLNDPPYQQAHAKWDKLLKVEDVWDSYDYLCYENSAKVLFGTIKSIMPYLQHKKFLKELRYDLVWDKNGKVGNVLNANKMPLRSHESIYVFYGRMPVFNKLKTYGHKNYNKTFTGYHIKGSKNWGGNNDLTTNAKVDDGSRVQTTIYRYSTVKGQQVLHPAQKPVPLLARMIETYSNEGDLVYDNTAGSFSTCEACLETKRSFLGVEMDDDFYNLGVQRIEDYLKVHNIKYSKKVTDL